MILVVGATGLLGSEICRRLVAQGVQVRALIRSTSDQAKIQDLRSIGVHLHLGDLKDAASLSAACQGVTAIISTASSTFSRQAGDSIETVDATGQLSLVDAAKKAGVQRFLFVSFRHSPEVPFPLADAKASVEAAIADMNFTVIQASFFMEVWLSPAMGFDYRNGTARIYGSGTSPISWVSYKDVAEMCVLALERPETHRQTIEFGGPHPVSPLQVVDTFQSLNAKPFNLDFVPVELLMKGFSDASDPMEKSFAALALGFAFGDAIEVNPIVTALELRLTSVEEYAREAVSDSTLKL